ncbi:helix-turn-helix domain-containing protein [Paracoccus litorisediminis]|uniref:helix-turn-helix domain-containing protein n=1 Tax=Paracoccus litorisediminis TaxID=2006130 RepID=UPI00372F8596
MGKHDLTFAPYMLSANDAAAYLGISETTLRGLPIPRKCHGSRRLYLRADLEAYAKDLPYEGDQIDSQERECCDNLFRGQC